MILYPQIKIKYKRYLTKKTIPTALHPNEVKKTLPKAYNLKY